MSKNQKKTASNAEKKGIFSTLWRWLRRAFFGGSNELAREMEGESAAHAADVEEIVSPGKQLLKNFMSRKLAVVALCIVILMFLFVFIGPKFMPKYSDAYTEVTQKSVPPCLSMLSVPRELQNNIEMIDSYGSFSVGLSKAGKVYVWGASRIGTTGIDIKNIPEEVQNANIKMIAAGIDHVIAIDENGKIYGWGNNRFGQFGRTQEMLDNPNIVTMSEELFNNGVDLANVKKLVCGYQ